MMITCCDWESMRHSPNKKAAEAAFLFFAVQV